MTNKDFIQKSGVKIPNAVIVSGITHVPEQDEQVIDFLKVYGKIEKILSVDSLSEFYQNLIVVYSSGSALEGLESQLPYGYIVI